MASKWPRLVRALVGGLVVSFVAAGCSSGTSTKSSARQVGGVVNYATVDQPRWIFPFVDPAHNRDVNIGQFQNLMYRPLYWLGANGQVVVNDSLSLADPPKFSDGNRTATIHLKNYAWSDGTRLSPENIAFWMGLDLSEKQKLAQYAPGDIPDDISSISYSDSARTVTFQLKEARTPSYFLSNELVQITPLPITWDLTADGQKGSCSSENRAQQAASCPAVYNYLFGLAKSTDQYAATSGPSAIWRVVDGPWRLSSYNPDGHITMVPNPKYSGPVKPSIAQLNYVPFTSLTAIENVLRSDSSLTVGPMPTVDLPEKPLNAALGSNPLTPHYDLVAPAPFWGVSYFYLNFNNPQVGSIFKQLYFRQSLQSVMDQQTDVKVAYRGYGGPTYGPVPLSYPGYAKPSNPYPFSVSKARSYLTSHGWTIPASGPATCTSPGTGSSQCGAGIPSGTRLEFAFETFPENPSLAEILQQFKSDASQAGIVLNIKDVPANQMVADATRCSPTEATCGWQIINWGGEGYAGGFPSGQALFQSDGALNLGSYQNPQLDQLIAANVTSGNASTMKAYSDRVASQLPVIFQPVQVSRILAVAANLKGVHAVPIGGITPEDWYFVKSSAS